MLYMFSIVQAWLNAHVRSERGQDLIEYALLGGLIAAAIVAVIALGTFTSAITALSDGISNCVDFKKSTTCGPF